VRSDLRAIFNDPAYAQQIQDLVESLRQGVISQVRPNGGDLTITVTRLITGTPTCIFVETTSDTSALFVHPTAAPASEYFELQPKQPRADPLHLNPTPWAFSSDEVFLTPTSAPSTCASA
jgi:hypothetical protein